MLTFWSRAQYMRREVEPDVTELQAHTSQLYPPSFWLTKKQAQRRWASSMASADLSKKHVGAGGAQIVAEFLPKMT